LSTFGPVVDQEAHGSPTTTALRHPTPQPVAIPPRRPSPHPRRPALPELEG